MTYSINVPDYVEDEVAYVRAAKRRIQANARKSRLKAYLARTDGQRVYDFLMQDGEFEPTCYYENEYGEGVKADDPGAYPVGSKPHPVCNASFGDFYSNMVQSLLDWGQLTNKQHDAVVNMIERSEKRVQQWEDNHAKVQANSQHIGTVGQRVLLKDLKVVRKSSGEGRYGVYYVIVMSDRDGNQIVYLGSSDLADKGDLIDLRATVKSHDEYQGVAQTKISRPVLVH